MPHNRGTRHKPKWVGHVDYKGQRKWVGTHATLDAYKQAEERCLRELRDQLDNPARDRVPTVIEFAGATIHADGRITMSWPDGQRAHKDTGRRESSIRRMREGLRPFVREHAHRRLDSFTRDEALTWTLRRGANTQQAVRQFFNHALDRDLIARNHFTRLGASKRRRRVDRPDFEIITNDQYARLQQAARESRADEYGLVLEGAVLAVGETAMRPGEIFALRRPDIDFEENLIHVKRQIDLDTGQITWPKDDQGRWVPMSPALREHLARMPRLGKTINREMGEIVFPAPQGAYMRRSNWSTHWKAICAAAHMPGQDFYELKHRAIQWMIDPPDEGGLGLDPATTATIVGHDDGGYLITTVYTKLTQQRALTRAQHAMSAYVRLTLEA